RTAQLRLTRQPQYARVGARGFLLDGTDYIGLRQRYRGRVVADERKTLGHPGPRMTGGRELLPPRLASLDAFRQGNKTQSGRIIGAGVNHAHCGCVTDQWHGATEMRTSQIPESRRVLAAVNVQRRRCVHRKEDVGPDLYKRARRKATAMPGKDSSQDPGRLGHAKRRRRMSLFRP